MWLYIVLGICAALMLFVCFALAVASFSAENFYEKFNETNKIRNSFGISTLEFVNLLNERYFKNTLGVFKCEEHKDHYSSGAVFLSATTMNSNSLASLATVSHELGHAKQAFYSKKLNKFWSLRKGGKVCGYFFLPLMIVGIVLSLVSALNVLESYFLYIGIALIGLGLLIFVFAIILKYKEIEIEKEASKFALDFLKEFLTEKEVKVCQSFLKSARLTYWASLFRTMLGWTFLTKKEGLFK